ncbi:chemotaxis-specific protein-glutamate methyltransferase CheB [Sphingomicrobium sp. B8]|uniref:Chemotaxis-specific protein-glutamate methyltransferase CheB n=2 Tax=Sphingomicrobium clamense TaxID=2851013 RepID=A0ABS6V627_9SPHN|nr:chemotaxis-specific protein-glutamate methyltransferase CheB [Sphingomicrobium sp. B8]
MLVDDSMVARAVLSRMIEMSPDFEVVGVAGTAEDALVALRETNVPVDIVILDLEMPGMGGLKSLPEILEAASGAQVLVVSSLAEEGAEATVKALAMGAADTLPKPGTGRFNGKFSDILLERLRALVPAPTASRENVVPRKSTPAIPANREMPDSDIGVLAIGSSTGGIHALASFFETLEGPIGAPILVTQHLPAAFMTVFARQLSMASGLPACVAEDNMLLKPDHIFVAPGDRHLTVKGRKNGLYVRLLEGRHASGCLPSVDPMFETAAEALGDKALGVILTGMGRDGLEGSRTMVAKGGAVIAQDEASCAVWGMPRAVAEAGLACAALPPADIARLVVERARGK